MQDIWPGLPILIWPSYHDERWQGVIADNVIAALEYRDPSRVCGISLVNFPSSILGRFVTKFPELTGLEFGCRLTDETSESPVINIPDSFVHQLPRRARAL